MGGIQLSDEEEEETMMDIVETLPSAMANNAGLSAAAVGQEEEEEDDELEGGDDSEIVLQEFNVHISHQLASALHLMQYPTRHLPFKEHSRPTHGRIKPQSRLIEMELSLDTEAAYFDRERAGLLGVGLDNKPLLSATDVKNGGKASENGMLQSQTLASCILPNAATYMIGVLRDDELHLTQISDTMQFKPSLAYLDKIHEKEKALTTHINHQEEKEKDVGMEDEEEGKLIQLQVKRLDEPKEEQRKTLQANIKKQTEDEAWANLVVYHKDTSESDRLFSHLFSTTYSRVSCTSTSSNYVDSFGPKIIEKSLNTRTFKPKIGRSLADMQALPMTQQVLSIMLNAHVVSFEKMRGLIDSKHSDAELIMEIQKYSHLVQGVWVLKSELIYKDRPMDARRYLLYLLSKSEFVHRADLGKVAPISHEMVTNMVAEIACFVHGKGWRLKVSPDRSFLSKFPQVQQQQTDNVVREGLAAKDRLSAKPKSTATTSSKAKKDSNINTAATTSGGEVVEEFPIKGETEDEQLVSLVRSVLLHHGLASMNYIERSVKKRMGDKVSKNNLLAGAGLSPEAIQKVVKSQCLKLNEFYALKELSSTLDEYRRVVISFLKGKTSFKKSEIVDICKKELSKEIPATVYGKIASEFAVSQGSKWILKTSAI